MREQHRDGARAQQPRSVALLVLLLVAGCSNSGASRPKFSPPNELAPRTTGCIDTPFIGPDVQRSTAGVQCGREASPKQVTLHGRVVEQSSAGLPGPGLEHLHVSVHPIIGALQLDRLPPALAETITGPQGAFAISLSNGGELVIVVRAEPAGPVLAARRIDAAGARADQSELVLLVSSSERPALTSPSEPADPRP